MWFEGEGIRGKGRGWRDGGMDVRGRDKRRGTKSHFLVLLERERAIYPRDSRKVL